jgi:hypothetical protein
VAVIAGAVWVLAPFTNTGIEVMVGCTVVAAACVVALFVLEGPSTPEPISLSGPPTKETADSPNPPDDAEKS